MLLFLLSSSIEIAQETKMKSKAEEVTAGISLVGFLWTISLSLTGSLGSFSVSNFPQGYRTVSKKES
jgi:hypothetical protein